MSIIKEKLPEYHFCATRIDYKISTEQKKILAGNWCLNYSNAEKGGKIEILDDVWKHASLREKDYEFIKNIKDQYCKELSSYLNKHNNENFPHKFWEILILPWLCYYLPTQLYRWKITKKILDEKKNISFFSFPDNDIKECVTDTISYHHLVRGDNEFNYFQFKRILKYLKNKGAEILFIERPYKKKINNNKKDSFLEKIKIYIFELLDSFSLFFTKKNDIFIDDKTFRKSVHIFINFHLKQFPFTFKKLFNYKLENKIFKKFKIDINKRKSIPLDDNVKSEIYSDFIQYINFTMRNNIPVCFLEGFSELKESAEKININPKLILSSVKFHHSEKFRFWTALNAIKNKTKFVITSHGLADYRKYESNYDMWHEMADTRITWATPRNEKEVKLPANNLIDFKKKRKYKKYLSYVTARQLFFPEEITQNGTDIQNEKSVQELDLDNIKKFNTILQKKIFDNLIFLPHKKMKERKTSSLNKVAEEDFHLDNNIYDWGNSHEIKNILKENYINKYNSPLVKYLFKSKIVICSYPGTAFSESILNGPAILLFKFSSDYIDDKYKKIFNELSKYKISFSNPEDAASHINNVWDNVEEWWNSKDVKNTIEEFLNQVAYIPNDSKNIWVQFFKNEINKMK